MKRLILIFGLLIVLVVVGGCASNYHIDDEILDKYSAKYDSDILKQFENNSEVLVIAFLDEFNDPVCYHEKLPEECIDIYKERWKRNYWYEDKVLSESASWSFRLERKGISTPSLTGYVSKKGFEELVYHQNVSYIILYDLERHGKPYSDFDIANPSEVFFGIVASLESNDFVEIGDDFGYFTTRLILYFADRINYENFLLNLGNLIGNYSDIEDFLISDENGVNKSGKAKLILSFNQNITSLDRFKTLNSLNYRLLSNNHLEKVNFDVVTFHDT